MDANQIATSRKVGKVVLFLGAETANWSFDQFRQAAQFARSCGVDSLAVKCADGPTVWYDTQGGVDALAQLVRAEGCGFVPYLYSYGWHGSNLDGEIAATKRLMSVGQGCVCVDMEQEWDGQSGWASTFAAAMQPVPGLLYLTTWADPRWQNWEPVISNIRACVNAWVPQQYDNFLSTLEGQFPSGLNIEPAINLPEAWPGPNDPVAVTHTAIQRGHSTVWLWEYKLATAHPDVVRNIVQAMASVNLPGETPAPAPAPAPAPEPAPAPAPAPAPERVHVVTGGDSLWKIAQEEYGNGGDWQRIYDANRAVIGSNPDLIRVGERLLIP